MVSLLQCKMAFLDISNNCSTFPAWILCNDIQACQSNNILNICPFYHASCIFQFIFKGEHALKSCKVHEIAFKMRRLSPRIKFQLIKSVLCDLSELKIFHYSNAVIKWTKSETHIHTSTRNTVRRENERKKYGERETTKMKIVWMNGVVEILHAKPK